MTLTHSFNLSPKEAIELQKTLRGQVRLEPLNMDVKTIGGADISLNRFGKVAYAGVIVLSFPDLAVVDYATIESEIRFPYIPGLLSFREIPALLMAYEKLKAKPDLLMVDGQGIAHPRRLGIASHLGLIIDKPTIGAAKSVLTGAFEGPSMEAGSVSSIYDNKTREVIGAAVRTKDKVKPMIISPGHRITLEESVDMVLRTTRRHRLPEPTRLAHNLVNQARRGEL